MCNVCLIELKKKNKGVIINRKIILSKKRAADVKLCYVHDIEFFVMGEASFFNKYKKYAQWLKQHMKSSDKDTMADYGDYE
jgi:hypothetical protein